MLRFSSLTALLIAATIIGGGCDRPESTDTTSETRSTSPGPNEQIMEPDGGESTDRSSANITTEEVKKEISEATEATRKLVEQKRDEYLRKMNMRLAEMQTEMDAMKERGKKLTAESKAKWNQKVERLKEKHESLEKQYDKLSEASGDAWGELQNGVEAAWEDLKAARENAREELNSSSP